MAFNAAYAQASGALLKIFLNKQKLFATLLAFAVSCTGGVDDELVIKPLPRETRPERSREADLSALDEAAKPTTKDGKLVADIRRMISAEVAEDTGSYKDATEHYFQAMQIATDPIAKEALHGWIRNYSRSLEQKTKATFVARILLDIAQEGRLVPYLVAKKLTTVEALTPIVQANAGKYLLPEEKQIATPPFPPAPDKLGIPDTDPLLTETAARFCKGEGDPGYQWQAWIDGLAIPIKTYWKAISLECQGNTRRAAEAYEQSASELIKNRDTVGLAINAAGKSARFWRANAGRERAANTYLVLMEAWENLGKNPNSMGLSPAELLRKRIDDTLWAARYRALIQDYEHAKIYTDLALRLINQAQASKSLNSAKEREQLADFRAEAYLILSNRIAVEEKSFGSASSQMLIALETPNLSRTMTDRLLWYGGFYAYLDGQSDHAISKWERLLSETDDDDLTAASYFWMARAYEKLKKPEKVREFSQQLSKRYPLSYYNVVALRQAGIAETTSWKINFGTYDDLVARLNEKDYRKEAFDGADSSLRDLIRRAEILNRANLVKWGKIATLALDQPFKRIYKIKSDPGAYVYLSRLHYVAENYPQSITYTAALAREVDDFWRQWPEQLLVHFPRPFADIFSSRAAETSLDKNLLYALSRQESAFNPAAKSPANAFGLMQLIVPTAERFADAAGYEAQDVREQLFQPEVAVGIGSHYLKSLHTHYQGYFPGVIGAYNAGEYVVDSWLERRKHSDPLTWIELVPFAETKDYIKNVWRNHHIYNYIERDIHAAYLIRQRERLQEKLQERFSP